MPTASAQGADAQLLGDVSIIIQGENDVIDGEESDNDFYALKILTFNLPYDVTRVYTKVPATARSLNVWASSEVINNTGYGFESSGANAGDFFVDVPSNHSRTDTLFSSIDTEAEFNASGSQFSNTTYSSGALRLIDGFDSGSYVSSGIQLATAQTITSATLAFNSDSSSNITSHLSNNGGISWTGCQNGSRVNFSTSGTALQVMFGLDGNASSGYLPSISSFSVTATYVKNSTVFTMHLSYLWTEDFVNGTATLDVSEAAEFAPSGSYSFMLYLVPGFEILSSGPILKYDHAGALSDYPDKDLYYNMTMQIQPQSYEIVVQVPEEKSYGLYYVAAIALIVAFGLAIVYSRRSRPRRPVAESEEPPRPSDEDGPSAEEQDLGKQEDHRKALVSRKKEMLMEIEAVRAGLSSGEISQEDARAKLPDLRKEFKKVRNELNRIPKKEVVSASESPIKPLDGETAGLESNLAAIARIDEDFEKGRLPEETYRSLRKEYVSKAAKALSEEGVEGSPADVEMGKLMEAIAALDEEYERGEIDKKVYVELSSSYRKQLVELMKRSERESR
jgi:hypothetical protein